MADIVSSASGTARRGRRSTAGRIDFTPMVDLGFLLITFFMLTTALAKPQIMALVMPEDDGGTRDPIKASKVLTLLLGANDKVYWYEGEFNGVVDSTNFDNTGLRRLILDKMARVEAQWGLKPFVHPKTGATGMGSQLYVLIKPAKKSRYKNLVDALDETTICKVRHYAILDPSTEEAKATGN